MNAQSLAAFALCLAPFTNASAAQSSYQAEALIVSGETSTTLSVPLPDESKGQLAGMKVDMIIEANGVLGIENLDKNATEALMFGVFGANIESMGGDPMVGQDGQFAAVGFGPERRQPAEGGGRQEPAHRPADPTA